MVHVSGVQHNSHFHSIMLQHCLHEVRSASAVAVLLPEVHVLLTLWHLSMLLAMAVPIRVVATAGFCLQTCMMIECRCILQREVGRFQLHGHL